MSNAAMPQHIPTEEVFGRAKRITLDLEKLTLSEHSAVVSMLHTMCVHRENRQKMDLQAKAQAFDKEQERLNSEAMAEARKAHAEAQVKREASIVSQIRGVGSPLPIPGHVPDKPKYEPSTEGEPNEQTLEQRANAAGLVLA